MHGGLSGCMVSNVTPKPSKISKVKNWVYTKVNRVSCNVYNLFFETTNENIEIITSRMLFLQFTDKNKIMKDENASHDALEAINAVQQAADLIVKMDENLKEEEDMLHERAIRLRRQSADAFKLMDDVKKIQKATCHM